MATNVQAIQREWKHLCGLAGQRWSQLTDEDFGALEGSFERLVSRIEQKTGEGRESIERFFTEMSSRGSAAVAQASDAASRYVQRAGDQIRQRYDDVEGLARSHPAETVIAVFGIGLVAGLVAGLALRGR